MSIITPEKACELSPLFKGRMGRVLFRAAMSITGLAKANATHERLEAIDCPPGPAFAKGIMDDLGVDFSIGNPERLKTLPEGAFITVSNHNYGHIDGICLVDLIGHVRPETKVMVNEFLMWIWGLAPNFISVSPKTNASTGVSSTSISGIKAALSQIREGGPLSLFPSGAVADLKPREHWIIRERDWQDAAVRLIQKARVPVVPIRFFDRNSWLYYSLGLIDYRIRFVRLFHEAYNKKGTHPRLGIGETISVEEQAACPDLQSLKALLRGRVDEMPLPDKFTLRSKLDI